MTIVITDGHFGSTDQPYTALDAIENLDAFAGDLELASDTNPNDIVGRVGKVASIRVAFPSSADGRGNSIARALRQAGYKGHLRAYGHVLADQYPLALRCGFDDVEIAEDLAQRQPQEQWQDAFKRVQSDYLTLLKSPHHVRETKLQAVA